MKTRPQEEIVVVGGSAAGLLAAKILSEHGRNVSVLECSAQLNPVPRTLIVTRRLRDLLGSVANQAVVHQIRRFELFSDGRSATVALSRPDLVIERAQLIRALAEGAQAAGTRLLLGHKFLGFTGNGCDSGLLVEANRGGAREELRAHTVIGADGAFSRVAQEAGWPRLTTAPLLQAFVRLPADYPQDTVRIWFVPEDTPYFYWLIPESAERGVLGLIGEAREEIRARLERFLDRRGFEPLQFQGARIPLYTGWVPVRRRRGETNVFLVGDAAAHAKVTTVGGIVTGFRGARGVAEAILNGGHSRELRALRTELNFHLLIRKTLHRFQCEHYAHLFDLMNANIRRTLELHTRDEATKIVWQLCLRQPRLLLLALRGLLSGTPFSRTSRR